MRRRSVAAVTSILQEDRDDECDDESPYEDVESCVAGECVHRLGDPMAIRIERRMASPMMLGSSVWTDAMTRSHSRASLAARLIAANASVRAAR